MVFPIFLTGILAAFVNFLLLLGTNRLLGSTSPILRAVAASVFAGAYSATCVIKGLAFLGGLFFRTVMLVLFGLIAYGPRKEQLQKAGVFALLHMALSWLSFGVGGGAFTTLFAATAILFLCKWSAPTNAGRYVTVELTYQDQTLNILALKDSGNTLKDPVTGESVVVIAAGIAHKLTGLTYEQLKDPVGSVSAMPGLRLIPYRSIGCSSGFMLAMRFKGAKIGPHRRDLLVAFAPQGLEGNPYQAITGGVA